MRLLFVLPAGVRTPRIDPGLFASARVDSGGLVVFLFATIQLRLGPPRLGICLFSALRVLHLSLLVRWGVVEWNFGCAFGLCFLDVVWLKQHEMLPVFLFLFFGVFFFLIGCFGKFFLA